MEKKEFIKKQLCDIADFMKWQVQNGKCTEEEMRSIYGEIIKNVDIDATIEDIAQHYGQSESNVRNVISRKMAKKPKRKVLYNFAAFLHIIPKSWK